MTLDFSLLSDDQLIDLIRAACIEATRRNLEAIAKNVMLDEADKAKLAREAFEREKLKIEREEAERVIREAAEKARAATESAARKAEEQRIAETWQYKDKVGVEVSAILKPTRNCELRVWAKGADKRIYVGGGYNDNDVEYYHTGTHNEKPRSIKIGFSKDIAIIKAEAEEVKAALLPVLGAICEKWQSITIPIPKFKEERQEVA